MASDFLGMELHALKAESAIGVTQIERTTLALVASTAEYTLPDDLLDIYVGPDNTIGTIVPSSGAETPVMAISRQDYLSIPNKTATGTPTLAFVERLAAVKIAFWLVPSATASFRYAKIRFPRDMDTGVRTLDLSRRWQKAICFSMAYQVGLAKSIPMQRVGFLRDESERLKKIARESDVEKGHGQFFVAGGRRY